MLKRSIALLVLFLSGIYTAQSQEAYFTLTPVLTPDASHIIFGYEGDLWQVSTEGGNALRLTAMQGKESHPSVSPDGKWLAFTSSQYGNNDVYVMPLHGGSITQLTFHNASDVVASWSWDSKKIYFESGRNNMVSTYTIDVTGGTPKRLFDHYFNTIHNVVEHPQNAKVHYFNESWESDRFAHRKRYKGDYNPDIKSYDSKAKRYTRHTDYRGKDFDVSFDKNGKLYFISDESNGEYNLYTIDNGVKKALTNFPTSIMHPRVSADGSKVVFRKDYQIYVYDVATQQTTKPQINIYQNKTLDQFKTYSVGGNVTAFDVSTDNKKIAFVTRGKLLVSDIKGKYTKVIATDPSEAVGEVKWLKDNETLLYSQTVDGYYNWFMIDAKANDNPKQLTSNKGNNREFSFNSDRSKGVYLSGRNDVYVMDMNTKLSTKIVSDELWGFYNSTPRFSPDDRYIAYNAYRDFETDVFVYDTKLKKNMNLTNTRVSESGPVWSPDGKYLYFSSDRLKPNYPYGNRGSKIYKMALDKFASDFKSDKLASVFEKEKESKKDDEAKEDDKKETEKPTVTINREDIMERLEQVGPNFGRQYAPTVVQSGNKTYIFYVSNHDEGENRLCKTTMEPFEKTKKEIVSDQNINGYTFVTVDDSHYILSDGNIHTIDIDGNKLEKIEIKSSFDKSFADEFRQAYYEAWAGFGENFYSEDFHGQDWEALRDRYATYLPYVQNRDNLRLLLNELYGELNTSHFGFSSSGDEEHTYYGARSAATGILFDKNNPYVVDRIVKQGPTDITGLDIKAGDRLVKVNGKEIDFNQNREQYFKFPKSQQELSLTFLRSGKEIIVKIKPTSYRKINDLLYDEWQDANQAYVDKMSDNRIAYIHMKNMTGGELVKFKQDVVNDFEADKEALILDLRYNRGGNVHDEVLNYLSRKNYLQWKYREGKLTAQPNYALGDKPIVLLINEQSLSDAEMTAAGFKALGLGTIMGTETYRWIIFTSGKGLTDGSFYRLPSWGCYTLDGKNLEAEGVKPDIRVDKNFKDRLDGTHPQLDRAIEHILNTLKK